MNKKKNTDIYTTYTDTGTKKELTLTIENETICIKSIKLISRLRKYMIKLSQRTHAKTLD